LPKRKILGEFLSRSARSLQDAYSIADLRNLARRRLPKAVFDFVDGGAGDEHTLKANNAVFDD
jgi:(S)-mandelate dehydrogenase